MRAHLPRRRRRCVSRVAVSALAKAHDLLAASNWAGADLRDIALAELAPYRERGEPMLLSLGAALMLGMVFHEPATNAAKHGAFTTAAGYVDVAWKKDGRRLIIDWRERDGPKAERPKQDGFGLKLIERGIAHELQGHATVHSSGDGHPARRRAGRAAAPPAERAGPVRM